MISVFFRLKEFYLHQKHAPAQSKRQTYREDDSLDETTDRTQVMACNHIAAGIDIRYSGNKEQHTRTQSQLGGGTQIKQIARCPDYRRYECRCHCCDAHVDAIFQQHLFYLEPQQRGAKHYANCAEIASEESAKRRVGYRCQQKHDPLVYSRPV